MDLLPPLKENTPPITSSTPPQKLAPVTTPAGKLLTRLKKRIPHSSTSLSSSSPSAPSPSSSSPSSSHSSSSSPLSLTTTTATTTTTTATHSLPPRPPVSTTSSSSSSSSSSRPLLTTISSSSSSSSRPPLLTTISSSSSSSSRPPLSTTSSSSSSSSRPPLSTTSSSSHPPPPRPPYTTTSSSSHPPPPRPPYTTTSFQNASSSSSHLHKVTTQSVVQKKSNFELRPDGTFVSVRSPPDRFDRPSGSVIIPPSVDPLALYTPKDAVWKAKPKKGAWTQYRTPTIFSQPERRTSVPSFASVSSRPKPFSHYSSPSQESGISFRPSQSDLEQLMEGITEVEEKDEESGQGTPAELLVTLKKYQLHGVAWMIEHENGKNAGGILADDMGLGKTIQSLALILSNRSKDPTCKTTLIVGPLGLIRQWEAEINTRCTKGTFKIYVHHGPRRTKDPKFLAKHDIVITTYQIATSEFPKDALTETEVDDDELDAAFPGGKTLKAPEGCGPLFGVFWHRIILDEGQMIKNRNTKSAMACFKLQAHKRWVLSGTPIQNSVEELYSLLHFLRIKPYSEFKAFRDLFILPLTQGRDKTVIRRLQVILKAVMLRRTKGTVINGKPILDLPPRIVDTNELHFSVDEREFYNSIEDKVLNSYESLSKAKGNQTTKKLVLLLRLRQACNHPRLVTGSLISDSEALEPKTAKEEDQVADELAMLMGGMNVGSTERSCSICLQSLGRTTTATECLSCQLAIQREKKKQESDEFESSSKIDEMMRLLEQTKRNDPTSKTIIFSQFTSMLDIAQIPIAKAGYVFCRYDGKMANQLREESLRRLKEDPKVTILLISLKCGSLGLNLISAHRVIMLDIWFNPMVEEQAIDRVHRLGQTRPVQVHRLVIQGTVEERIMVLQEKKRALAKGALGGEGMKKSGALTIDDFRFLFSKAAEHAEPAD